MKHSQGRACFKTLVIENHLSAAGKTFVYCQAQEDHVPGSVKMSNEKIFIWTHFTTKTQTSKAFEPGFIHMRNP